MIKIEELPKEPINALQAILIDMLGTTLNGNAQLAKLKEVNHKVYRELLTCSIIAQGANARIDYPSELKSSIQDSLKLEGKTSLNEYHEELKSSLTLLSALQFENHFIDQELEHEFDSAELSKGEKLQIRSLMAETRRLVDQSNTLPDWARRNVLYHVSKIENELHRETSRFQAFLAASAQMSGLMKQVGEDAKPIADRIQEARTITERKVDGLPQIETDEKPKQLPKPATT